MSDKSALRKEAEDRRRQLARPDFATRLADHADTLVLAAGAMVSGYAAFRDEADPKALLLALGLRGHPLALPVITAKGQPLRFHRWQPSDALITHAFGVQEPHPSADIVIPDVLLMPLLAFDSAGHRLGYGGGYYDRTLQLLRAQKPITAIGIAYAGQQIAAVPHEAHDQRLDAVLTEDGLTRFSDPA
jgi:5-formyltetrahydrofolate cyclo-ligase